MAFTSYTDAALLGHLLGSTTYTKPSALYVALFVGDPLAGGVEVSTSGTGYARQSGTFSVATNVATNASNIEYSAATTAWGTITHVAIYDAMAAGNQLVTAALTTAKTISVGDILRIPTSDLSVTLS